MIQKYNKLIRDKIPEIIEASGKTCRYKTLTDMDYLQMLEAKLDEELAEYHADKSIEEMADLLEVMRAVVTARGWTWLQLEQMRADKVDERGGFEKKLLLKSVTTPENAVARADTICNKILAKQDAIFERLKKSAILDYFWIQDNYNCCDVSTDETFRRRFGHFYRMRFVSKNFREAFFCVFEEAKHTPMSFETITETLLPVDGTNQFSFITKMLHTLDTDQPIYDSMVDAVVGLKRKDVPSLEERLVTDRAILNELSALYRKIIATEQMKPILERFGSEYPEKSLSDIKKVDFLLWALGAEDKKEKERRTKT